MATLVLIDDRNVQGRSFRLVKAITTLGRSRENDIFLEDNAVSDYHAHILKEKSGHILASLDPRSTFVVNGIAGNRKVLEDGDVITVGRTRFRFTLQEVGTPSHRSSPIEYMKKLYEFSETLMKSYSLDDLLEPLMDSLIDMTGAQTGFLILSEGDGFVVKVARNFRKEKIEGSLQELSDTVIRKVLSAREPLIVSDALKDENFKMSESIVNLKLRSVMGVPLLVGGKLLGMIYVGNDRAAALFTQADLEVLTVFASQAALIINNAILLDDLKVKYDGLVKRVEETRFGDLLGSSPSMQKVFRTLDKVAATDFPLLIIGESGTGKDILCREIHRRSGRPGPLVVVECASISSDVLQDDLGVSPEKNSRVDEAREGTLVLREVSALPLSIQAQLLDVLDKYDTVRFLATSARDIEKEKGSGGFRDALFYRLGRVIIHLPPLRERSDDIELLARYILLKVTQEMGIGKKDFTPEALSAMLRYAWPGNIVELENKVRRALVLSSGHLVTPDDLEFSEEDFAPLPSLADAKENFTRAYIEKVLRYHRGDKESTARDLGINIRTIYRYVGKGG